jgi:hypothetical protein
MKQEEIPIIVTISVPSSDGRKVKLQINNVLLDPGLSWSVLKLYLTVGKKGYFFRETMWVTPI